MKKIIFSLTMSAALLSSVFTYAAEKNEPGTKVTTAFKNEFSQVDNVEWVTLEKAGVYQAKFTFNNESLQAFFTEEGEFLGTTRQILKSQLPFLVASNFDKQYSDARIVTIFEYSKKDGLEYFITVVNSKGSSIVKVTANGELSVYKKNLQ